MCEKDKEINLILITIKLRVNELDALLYLLAANLSLVYSVILSFFLNFRVTKRPWHVPWPNPCTYIHYAHSASRP
eukprot:SAG31_NODE_1451_length_8305_cov_8.321350_9_plen_75_part_00